MRRNLFMLTFGLLSGTVAAGCLHDSHKESYRANITGDLGRQKDPVALAKPERAPLAIGAATASEGTRTVSATGAASKTSLKTISSSKLAPRADLAANNLAAPPAALLTPPTVVAHASPIEAVSPRKGLVRSGAREVPASHVASVLPGDCNCATSTLPVTAAPTIPGTIVPVQHVQTQTLPASGVPNPPLQHVQYAPVAQAPGTYSPVPQIPAQPVPAQHLQAGHVLPAPVPGIIPQHGQTPQVPGAMTPQAGDGGVGPGYLLVPDNSDIAQEQMKKGVVLWDAPPLGGKGAAVAPSAFSSPIEKVRSVVDPVIDGQVFYKAQGDLALPNLPVTISQTMVANVDNIHFGPQNNFQSITGQIHSFKGTWRLRYASVESADPFGGCIALVGEGLDSLKEGQLVRVHGVILPPSDRTTPHRYQTSRVEIIAGQ